MDHHCDPDSCWSFLATAMVALLSGAAIEWANIGRSTEFLRASAICLLGGEHHLLRLRRGGRVAWVCAAASSVPRLRFTRVAGARAGWAGWHVPLFAFSPDSRLPELLETSLVCRFHRRTGLSIERVVLRPHSYSRVLRGPHHGVGRRDRSSAWANGNLSWQQSDRPLKTIPSTGSARSGDMRRRPVAAGGAASRTTSETRSLSTAALPGIRGRERTRGPVHHGSITRRDVFEGGETTRFACSVSTQESFHTSS